MRILTVRQPWAWAIIHGGKDVENRVRNIAGAYRGPVAIHAGLARFEDDGQYWEVRRAIETERQGWVPTDADLWSSDLVDADDPRFVYGAIIGVVDLDEVHTPATDLTKDDFCESSMGDLCSPWAEVESFHLVFENPRALDEPIPYKGALGLRKTDLSINGDYLVSTHEPGDVDCVETLDYACDHFVSLGHLTAVRS